MKKYLGLFKQTIGEFTADKVPRLGAALAYYTIFSLAPLLLIVLRRRVRLMRRLQPVTSRAERAVLIWGGLRGALTITLALALPPEFPERQLMIAMAFGVVLFSLLVQGVTLSLLVRRTGLAAVK